MLIDSNGTCVQARHSAQAQNESDYRSEQISAGIFERVVFRPVAPYLVASAFDGESHPIAIEKDEVIPTGESANAQVRRAVSIVWTGIEDFGRLRRCGEYRPILQPYPYVKRI
jgi:hypothetical protein